MKYYILKTKTMKDLTTIFANQKAYIKKIEILTDELEELNGIIQNLPCWRMIYIFMLVRKYKKLSAKLDQLTAQMQVLK